MPKFSLSLVLTVLFFLFVARSIYSLYSVFDSPRCKAGDVCYHSYLNGNPQLDLLVYLSDNSKSGDFELILHVGGFDYREPYEKEITIDVPPSARNNGTLFIHTLFVPSKAETVHSPKRLPRSDEAAYVKGKLTKYAVPQSETFNLLKQTQTEHKFKPVAHLRSRYAVLMCTEELHIPRQDIPIEIMQHMRVTSNKILLPIAVQDFLNMRLRDLKEIKPDTRTMTFAFVYNPATLGKMRFFAQMEVSLKQFLQLGFTEKDLDEVKGVFADTNLYLLCATMAIGSIHLLLDFLSFKNDVSFWRSQTSMAGLSTRTVLWRAFSQFMVFLYLLDEGTSLLVLIPSGIGTLIEFWKVNKVCKTKMSLSWAGLSFKQDVHESAEEAETRKYDEECMKYLSYLLYPLCMGAAIYSLMYQPHKSWYSWTINSLVNGVYAFGFLFMLPQLFINYRLKSVAALPWRAFTYRAFNTFIDDIFAFIITMPTAHRLACFRDDVVFLVYLYQRWLYPVDKSRTDDMTGEVVPENEKKKKK
ncbi:lipid scramblase CLPTM1L [Cylas formicarius]|uniref:lipid scramblase CLPTM1L n=1 Tax=Cylas formicarius TaxID=197179 RepID=UPI002958369B|nr:lipid scramblase CLPTM1L [Cylas formicarius]